LVLHADVAGADSPGLATLLNPFSPFVVPPRLQAEVRLTPTWVWLLGGSGRFARQRLSFDLKRDMALERDGVFLDWMVRLQTGRLSLRVEQSMRDFKGLVDYQQVAGRPTGEARLEYSGLRVGGDIDFFQWNKSRVGINVDLECYSPVFWASFVENDLVARGKKITGDWPTTAGVHAVLFTAPTFAGISGVFEARARWPIRGASVTDWEIIAGFTFPEIHFGTVGFRTGYRRTSVEFKDRLNFNQSPATAEFQIDLGGWFGEIVYYY